MTPTPPADEATAVAPVAKAPKQAKATRSPEQQPTPAPTSPEALAVWLAGRRWFTGTGHDRPTPDRDANDNETEADGAAPAPVPPFAVSLSTVDLAAGRPLAIGLVEVDDGARYQLLVPGPEQGDRPDVADDPDAAAELATWVAAGATSAPAAPGTVGGHWSDPTDRLGDAAARPLGAEQSNTSVVIGGTHVLKLFRRLQSGPHPEIEVGRHLAAVAAAGTTAPVAALSGWYDLQPADGGESTALGVVQHLVPGALDAWALVLSGLAGDAGGLLARLHQLGASLARLHVALAAPGADGPTTEPDTPEAFGAVPLGPARVAELATALAADARRVLGTGLDRPAALVPVVGHHEAVAALADLLVADLGDDLGAAIRHHGDLHLGQVVDSHDGWVILDFEGEPTRPLAERRRRHSPLRDVAGMLRSFAYAAATHRRSDGRPLPEGWEPAARAAFLDGYLATVDPALLPESAVATATLLTLLELEKVVYEIDYELAHRPDWVDLPVDGLQRLLARSGS